MVALDSARDSQVRDNGESEGSMSGNICARCLFHINKESAVQLQHCSLLLVRLTTQPPATVSAPRHEHELQASPANPLTW